MTRMRYIAPIVAAAALSAGGAAWAASGNSTTTTPSTTTPSTGSEDGAEQRELSQHGVGFGLVQLERGFVQPFDEHSLEHAGWRRGSAATPVRWWQEVPGSL